MAPFTRHIREVIIFCDTQTSLLTGGSNWLEVMIFRDTQTSLLAGGPNDLLDF